MKRLSGVLKTAETLHEERTGLQNELKKNLTRTQTVIESTSASLSSKCSTRRPSEVTVTTETFRSRPDSSNKLT
jgi:hypothetical protein